MVMTLEQLLLDCEEALIQARMYGAGNWSNICDAIDARLVQHNAMMAKLRQMSKQMNTSMHKVVAAYGVALDDILSTEPADPVKMSKDDLFAHVMAMGDKACSR